MWPSKGTNYAPRVYTHRDSGCHCNNWHAHRSVAAAVQSSREASRRLQCTNNLKQIGLALLNYESSHKVFPPGYVSQVDSSGNDTGPGWGWASMILPQMEQTPIHNVIHFDLPIEHATNGVRVAS